MVLCVGSAYCHTPGALERLDGRAGPSLECMLDMRGRKECACIIWNYEYLVRHFNSWTHSWDKFLSACYWAVWSRGGEEGFDWVDLYFSIPRWTQTMAKCRIKLIDYWYFWMILKTVDVEQLCGLLNLLRDYGCQPQVWVSKQNLYALPLKQERES